MIPNADTGVMQIIVTVSADSLRASFTGGPTCGFAAHAAGRGRSPAPTPCAGQGLVSRMLGRFQRGSHPAGRAAARDYDWPALAARLTDCYETLPVRPARTTPPHGRGSRTAGRWPVHDWSADDWSRLLTGWRTQAESGAYSSNCRVVTKTHYYSRATNQHTVI